VEHVRCRLLPNAEPLSSSGPNPGRKHIPLHDEKELLISQRGSFNEPRNMAIYLTRRLRGDGLKQIGEQFQVKKYSSVSSVIERM
jgi:hypothetical protein